MIVNREDNYNDTSRTAEDGKPGFMPRLSPRPPILPNWKAMLAVVAACLGLFYIVHLGVRVEELSQRLNTVEIEVRDIRKLGMVRTGEMVAAPGFPSGRQGP
jgi:hypothetical protein